MLIRIILTTDFNRKLPGNMPVRQLIWLPFFWGDNAMKNRSIIYIDGFNLYYGAYVSEIIQLSNIFLCGALGQF